MRFVIHWQNAMRDEYAALIKNNTRTLVPRPTDTNIICSMRLFRHKYHSDGTLSHYKACLVANGSTQLKGVDVDETFSPVVKLGTIHTVLSLASSRHWPVHQFDVKSAFLHGDISETVYIHQPLGFQDSLHLDYVCLLQRSLYGLKQALRVWFQQFASYITRVGFHHSPCDSSIFIYRQGMDTAYLLLHVDDIGCSYLKRSMLLRFLSGLSLAGSLQYLTFTRPDISYAVQQIEMVVHYSEIDFSAEAEYRGVVNVVAETCWLHNLLRELHTPVSSTAFVYCANANAIYLSCNPVQHRRTKHIEIDIHFVHDFVVAGQVRVLYVC
ncbi:ribonuclease H-like domain-containing protein [Tanacetum coccineum]|uniref:Ribonuclease H-like domain-containing protein n=1 Tax=Tanacetum coccineum TaxID=301880 RepID=A0ABQ5IFG9_9ASTR